MNFKICVSTGKEAPLSELHPFQNDMKTLMPDDYLRLRTEIEETGFSFAVHVWEDDDGLLRILDGHQRVECVRRMMVEEASEEDPMLPIVEVEAKNFREAKRKCLAGASAYGKVNLDGVAATLKDAQILAPRAASMFRFPEIDLKALDPAAPKQVTFQASTKAKEPKLCPHCQKPI